MPHATWHSGNTVHKPRTNGTAQAQRIIKAGTRPHEARGGFLLPDTRNQLYRLQ